MQPISLITDKLKSLDALMQGHFLLSSGKHSEFYLQIARLLEHPSLVTDYMQFLIDDVTNRGINFDAVCAPALGGILVGYEFARMAQKRFIFTERVNGVMTLRRGFEVKKGERFIICEDVITTGGSALECAKIIEDLGGVVESFVSFVNRGFCPIANHTATQNLKPGCKLPADKPLIVLQSYDFDVYEPNDCPLCKLGLELVKPGSRGN